VATYINPPKDTVSFGYRVTDMYFTDTNLKETHFIFKLDTGIGYAWQEILVEYDKTGITKQYIPEYTNYRIVKLNDMSSAGEYIEIAYTQVGEAKRTLISTIKYRRLQNPIAIQFVYNTDTGLVQQILKRQLTVGGDLGTIQDQYDFCLTTNLGACTASVQNESYQYSSDFNSLRYCNELVPFILLLSKPDFQDLEDISSILPYYFSQNLPQSSILYQKGIYQYGLNKKEPTFLYFKPLNSLRSEGFQFSMRIY
jgi:hypothetical protein